MRISDWSSDVCSSGLVGYSGYETTTLGSGVRLNFPLSLNSRGSLRYTLRQDEVDVISQLCDPVSAFYSPALCGQRGKFITSLVGYGYRLDHRNDYIQPTRGCFTEINQAFAGVGGPGKTIQPEANPGRDPGS